MKYLLEGLLPRLYPGLNFLCITHEGKQDLEKSIPRKLRGWREPGVRFVIIRDNDRSDCHKLKDRLVGLCKKGGREDALVRIACQELEAWYLGEPDALADAFGNDRLRDIGSKALFRIPDEVGNPFDEIKKLVPEFQKVTGARRMAKELTRDRNKSCSFQVFLQGIDRMNEVLQSTMEDEAK
ncbi:MAG TPA: DUF4276 family protein [bacterium]|nr:DUF4276 family protein [bacterium]